MDPLFDKKDLRVMVVGRNLEDLLPILDHFPVQLVESDPELVISYGGDGSLLGAEKRFPGVPKCPLRDSRQNPKCPKHSERQVLEWLFQGQLECRLLTKLVAQREDGSVLRGLNDIVMSRRLISSAIRYRVWFDGELYRGQVVADGLVIATPFGSTGYFQSITRGNFQSGIGLAFNNAMDLCGFTVVPEETQISIELLRGPADMVADNDPAVCQLETGSKLLVKADSVRTPVYGIDVFRCADCYNLRRNGV